MPAESQVSLGELRVLELCGGVAGAYCGKLFADYGGPRNLRSMVTCSLIAGSYVGRNADDAADAEGERGGGSTQAKLADAAQEGAAAREKR